MTKERFAYVPNIRADVLRNGSVELAIRVAREIAGEAGARRMREAFEHDLALERAYYDIVDNVRGAERVLARNVEIDAAKLIVEALNQKHSLSRFLQQPLAVAPGALAAE